MKNQLRISRKDNEQEQRSTGQQYLQYIYDEQRQIQQGISKQIISELDNQIHKLMFQKARLQSIVLNNSQNYYQTLQKQQTQLYQAYLKTHKQYQQVQSQQKLLKNKYKELQQTYGKYVEQEHAIEAQRQRLENTYRQEQIRVEGMLRVHNGSMEELQDQHRQYKENMKKYQYLQHKIRNLDTMIAKQQEYYHNISQLSRQINQKKDTDRKSINMSGSKVSKKLESSIKENRMNKSRTMSCSNKQNQNTINISTNSKVYDKYKIINQHININKQAYPHGLIIKSKVDIGYGSNSRLMHQSTNHNTQSNKKTYTNNKGSDVQRETCRNISDRNCNVINQFNI